MYKPFATFLSSMAIAVILGSFVGEANSTEYIFTAPPEVDHDLVEIPASETDYPLYECDSPSSDSETEQALDSHNCNCVECEDVVRDSESENHQTSQNEQGQNEQDRE